MPAVGIFSIDFSSQDNLCLAGKMKMTLHPWFDSRWPGTTHIVRKTGAEDLPSILGYCPESVSVSISSKQILQTWIPSLNIAVPDSKDEYSVETAHSHPLTHGSVGEEKLVEMLTSIWKENVMLNKLSIRLIDSLQAAVERRLANLPTFQSRDVLGNVLYFFVALDK